MMRQTDATACPIAIVDEAATIPCVPQRLSEVAPWWQSMVATTKTATSACRRASFELFLQRLQHRSDGASGEIRNDEQKEASGHTLRGQWRGGSELGSGRAACAAVRWEMIKVGSSCNSRVVMIGGCARYGSGETSCTEHRAFDVLPDVCPERSLSRH